MGAITSESSGNIEMYSKINEEQEDVFKKLPVPKALLKMILPAVASQLIVLIYNMADTFLWDRPIIHIWWQASP